MCKCFQLRSLLGQSIHCRHIDPICERCSLARSFKGHKGISYFGAVGPPEEALVVVGTTTIGVVVVVVVVVVVLLVVVVRVVAGAVVSMMVRRVDVLNVLLVRVVDVVVYYAILC